MFSTNSETTIGLPATKKADKAAVKRIKKEKPLKQTQILMKKDPLKPSVKHAGPDSSSSSETEDSDSDLEVEMDEPSPIPPARPQDPEGGIRYDTLKAVWWPRNKQPAGSAVKNAMILFSDTIKSVRDTWKMRSEALKVAENQNQEDKIPAIKKDVIFQRRLLDLIINTTLEYGHPAFVARYVLFHLFVFPDPAHHCCRNNYSHGERWRNNSIIVIFWMKSRPQHNKSNKQEPSRLCLESTGFKSGRGKCAKLEISILFAAILYGDYWCNPVAHEIHEDRLFSKSLWTFCSRVIVHWRLRFTRSSQHTYYVPQIWRASNYGFRLLFLSLRSAYCVRQ